MGKAFDRLGGVLELTLDDDAAAYLAQNEGSWRQLVVTAGPPVTHCQVRLLAKGSSNTSGEIIIKLKGTGTAGGLADMVIKELRARLPARCGHI